MYVQFKTHLKQSPCKSYSSDIKLRTPTGNFRYPDCMVVCEDNSIDEKTKYLEYINIPTLKEYVIIEQDMAKVTVFKLTDQWRPTPYYLGEEITFESIDLIIAVTDIYDEVENTDMQRWLEERADQN